jgi:hypothetical protein
MNSADHYRVNVYCTTLDTVACQMRDHFHDDILDIFDEMGHFKPRKLTTEDQVTTDNIANLCKFYDL